MYNSCVISTSERYTYGTFAERYRRALVILARGCPFQGMEEWRNKGVLLMGNTNQWNTKPRGRAVDMRAEARHERAVQTKGICARVCLFLSRSRSPPSRSPLTFSLPPSRSNPARPSSPACFLFLFLSRPLFFSFRVHTDTRRRVCGRARAHAAPSSSSAPLSDARTKARERERVRYFSGWDI